MIRNTAMEYMHGVMGRNTRDGGLTANRMATEFTIKLMVAANTESGRMARSSNGWTMMRQLKFRQNG